MSENGWVEETREGVPVFRPSGAPSHLLVAFSGRGIAPPAESSPTAFLARRFAQVLSLEGAPIVRASQVHGNRAIFVREAPRAGEVSDAGECDVVATALPGVALAVQTADCVAILLAGQNAVGAVHSGWRGTVRNVASVGVAALSELGEEAAGLCAWLGPSIGPCCYEVGDEVASRFAGAFLRPSGPGRSHLDLAAANRAQLTGAGLSPERIWTHPACTRCGGQQFASYRRDGTGAGRMIGLIVRLGLSTGDLPLPGRIDDLYQI
jgi:YfiH family protein